MSRTKPKAAPRKPAPRFELTKVERMLLMLYRTVGIETRAEVGTLLFNAWTNTPVTDKDETQERYKAAGVAFKTGGIGINTFDDLRAGGYRRVEEIEGGAR